MKYDIKKASEAIEYKDASKKNGQTIKQNHTQLRKMLRCFNKAGEYPSFEEYKEVMLELNEIDPFTPEALTEGAMEYLWEYQAKKFKQESNLKPNQNQIQNQIETNSKSKENTNTKGESQRTTENNRECQRTTEATENYRDSQRTTENLSDLDGNGEDANTNVVSSLNEPAEAKAEKQNVVSSYDRFSESELQWLQKRSEETYLQDYEMQGMCNDWHEARCIIALADYYRHNKIDCLWKLNSYEELALRNFQPRQ